MSEEAAGGWVSDLWLRRGPRSRGGPIHGRGPGTLHRALPKPLQRDSRPAPVPSGQVLRKDRRGPVETADSPGIFRLEDRPHPAPFHIADLNDADSGRGKSEQDWESE